MTGDLNAPQQCLDHAAGAPTELGLSPVAAIPHALARKRRGLGLSVVQRLWLVVTRLEAGMRETPQRFVPVAHWLAKQTADTRRAVIAYLVSDALAEAATDPSCTAKVRELLERSQALLSCAGPLPDDQHWTLLVDIMSAERIRSRRRHIHCHGEITTDRRLLLLRTVMASREPETITTTDLGWAIAYALSDYDRDHFEMRGPRVAQRVARFADYLATLRPATVS